MKVIISIIASLELWEESSEVYDALIDRTSSGRPLKSAKELVGL